MANRTADQHDWNFRQVFGDTCAIEAIQEGDMIGSIRFNQDGSFLAAGDRSGRVIIFERAASPEGGKAAVEYCFYAEFQSHEPDFDSLRSVQISERIVQIQWLPPSNGALFLLTTNERTVKIWRVANRLATQVAQTNVSKSVKGVGELLIPRVQRTAERMVTSILKRTFSNVTMFHINSISTSCAGDQFLVADDLRINIWSVDHTSEAFSIVDLKPASLEDVQEVITYADYHPKNGSIFTYGTSHGTIKLCDTRKRALCDTFAKQYSNPFLNSVDCPYGAFATYSGQSDIAAAISGLHITQDGNNIVARDFLTVKIWDIRSEGRPMITIPIHPFVKDYAQRLLETDALFDRYDVAISPDCRSIITGSFSDRFHIYGTRGRDISSVSGIAVMATRQVRRRSKQILQHLNNRVIPSSSVGALPIIENGKVISENLLLDTVDVRRRIQYIDWHPTENIIAVGTLTNLFIYAANN